MSDTFSKSLIISTLQMYKQNLYAAHTSVGRHNKTSLITTSPTEQNVPTSWRPFFNFWFGHYDPCVLCPCLKRPWVNFFVITSLEHNPKTSVRNFCNKTSLENHNPIFGNQMYPYEFGEFCPDYGQSQPTELDQPMDWLIAQPIHELGGVLLVVNDHIQGKVRLG